MERFENMFGDSAEKAIYTPCIKIFKSHVNGTFGMSANELYTLAQSK